MRHIYFQMITCSFLSTIFFALLMLTGFSVQADGIKDQPDEKSEENVNVGKKEFKEAIKYFYAGKYDKAYPLFDALVKSDKDNSNLNFYLGVCILNTTKNVSTAKPYFEIAIRKTTVDYYPKYKEERAPAFAYYYLGIIYHFEYEFNKAITYLRKFRSAVPYEQRELRADVDRRMNMAKDAKKLVKKPVENIDIAAFPGINSAFNDFGAMVDDNETLMFFTSRRYRMAKNEEDLLSHSKDLMFTTWENDIKMPKVSKANDEYKSSVFFMAKEGGNWSFPKYFETINNADANNVFGCLSFDGKYLFYSSDVKGNQDIYYCESVGINQWTAPKALGSNLNSTSNETNACLSPDGNTLYFVSDRKDGYGGKDIYYSNKLEDGTWGKAVNLGRRVNTKEDEESPFITEDGNMLYFSSKGHSSMGGYDVFYTKSVGNKYYNKFISNNWGRPENIGYPINTVYDDLSYKVFNKDRITLFTSANKEGARQMDIYMVSYKEQVVDTQDVTYAKVTIEEKKEELIPDTKIVQDEPEKKIITEEPKQEEKTYVEEKPVKPGIIEKEPVKKVIQDPFVSGLYTIVLGEADYPEGYFDGVPGIKYYQNEEGKKRYYVGEYTELKDAEAYKRQLWAIGYTSAYVTSIDGGAVTGKLITTTTVEQKKKEQPVEKDYTQKKIIEPEEKVAEMKEQEPDVFAKEPVEGKTKPYTKQIHSGVKLYTVQVGAGNMDMDYFNELSGVKTFIGSDGVKRYTVGEYTSVMDAESRRREIKAKGYKAWVREMEKEIVVVKKTPAQKETPKETDMPPADTDYQLVDKYPCRDYDNNVYYEKYTIQIGAGNMRYEYFNKIDNVVICEGLHGLKRFVVGEFDNLSSARLYRMDLVQLGYRDAWIPSLKDHLCNCYKMSDVYQH